MYVRSATVYNSHEPTYSSSGKVPTFGVFLWCIPVARVDSKGGVGVCVLVMCPCVLSAVSLVSSWQGWKNTRTHAGRVSSRSRPLLNMHGCSIMPSSGKRREWLTEPAGTLNCYWRKPLASNWHQREKGWIVTKVWSSLGAGWQLSELSHACKGEGQYSCHCHAGWPLQEGWAQEVGHCRTCMDASSDPTPWIHPSNRNTP